MIPPPSFPPVSTGQTAQGRDQFPVPMHFLLTATKYAATHNCLAGVRHDAVRIEHEVRRCCEGGG